VGEVMRALGYVRRRVQIEGRRDYMWITDSESN